MRMNAGRFCTQAITLCILTQASSRGLPAQLPENVMLEPDSARIEYADLDRFANVYRRLLAVRDSAALLDSAYLANGALGLRTYERLYDLDAPAVLDGLRRHPDRYHTAAVRGPAELRALEPRLRAALRRLEELYPGALFPPVHYLVGDHRAGGSVQPEGVLIAVEVYGDTTAGRTLAGLVPLVIHELVHYQQAAADYEAYRAARTLLARAIREGAADFVTEIVAGRHINASAHAYGNEHEAALWRRFRCDMHGTDTGDWFFRTPAEQDWPQDLGYFIGYRIVAHYYAREMDPARALESIIQRTADPEWLLRESGYEMVMADRLRSEEAADPPQPCTSAAAPG